MDELVQVLRLGRKGSCEAALSQHEAIGLPAEFLAGPVRPVQSAVGAERKDSAGDVIRRFYKRLSLDRCLVKAVPDLKGALQMREKLLE
jgi:hypothetical protein